MIFCQFAHEVRELIRADKPLKGFHRSGRVGSQFPSHLPELQFTFVLVAFLIPVKLLERELVEDDRDNWQFSQLTSKPFGILLIPNLWKQRSRGIWVIQTLSRMECSSRSPNRRLLKRASAGSEGLEATRSNISSSRSSLFRFHTERPRRGSWITRGFQSIPRIFYRLGFDCDSPRQPISIPNSITGGWLLVANSRLNRSTG